MSLTVFCLKNLRNHLIFFLIFSIGIVLRRYCLDKYDIWYDEAVALILSEDVSLLNFFNFSAVTNTPFFLLLLHGWREIVGNESVFILKLFPFVWGALSIILIHRIGEKLFNYKVGLISALFLAVAPFHVYYSREISAYTLFLFFSLCSVYFLIICLEKDRWFLWICLVVATSFCLNSHNTGIFVLLIQNFYFFGSRYKNKKKYIKWIASQCIVLVLCLPRIFAIIDKLFNQGITELFFWVPDPSLATLYYLFNAFNLGYNADMVLYSASFLLFFVLFVSGLVGNENKKNKVFLLSWLLVPLIGIAILSIFLKGGSFFLYRIFIIALPAYFLIIANGLARYSKRLSYSLLIAILIFTMLSLRNYYNDISFFSVKPYRYGVFEKKENRVASEYIKNNFQTGDFVVHTCRSTLLPFIFYHRINVSTELTPEEKDLAGEWGILGKNIDWEYWRKFYQKGKREFSKVQEAYDIRELIRGKKRAWLVVSSWDIEKRELYGIRTWMDSRHKLLMARNFKGIDIYLYNLER